MPRLKLTPFAVAAALSVLMPAVAPAQTGLMQARGKLLHHSQKVSPGQRLPDTVFLFTHGGRGWALTGVLLE